jgi:hypothetical protein
MLTLTRELLLSVPENLGADDLYHLRDFFRHKPALGILWLLSYNIA